MVDMIHHYFHGDLPNIHYGEENPGCFYWMSTWLLSPNMMNKCIHVNMIIPSFQEDGLWEMPMKN